MLLMLFWMVRNCPKIFVGKTSNALGCYLKALVVNYHFCLVNNSRASLYLFDVSQFII